MSICCIYLYAYKQTPSQYKQCALELDFNVPMFIQYCAKECNFTYSHKMPIEKQTQRDIMDV